MRVIVSIMSKTYYCFPIPVAAQISCIGICRLTKCYFHRLNEDLLLTIAKPQKVFSLFHSVQRGSSTPQSSRIQVFTKYINQDQPNTLQERCNSMKHWKETATWLQSCYGQFSEPSFCAEKYFAEQPEKRFKHKCVLNLIQKA